MAPKSGDHVSMNETSLMVNNPAAFAFSGKGLYRQTGREGGREDGLPLWGKFGREGSSRLCTNSTRLYKVA